jgi:hypothetical protein
MTREELDNGMGIEDKAATPTKDRQQDEDLWYGREANIPGQDGVFDQQTWLDNAIDYYLGTAWPRWETPDEGGPE